MVMFLLITLDHLLFLGVFYFVCVISYPLYPHQWHSAQIWIYLSADNITTYGSFRPLCPSFLLRNLFNLPFFSVPARRFTVALPLHPKSYLVASVAVNEALLSPSVFKYVYNQIRLLLFDISLIPQIQMKSKVIVRCFFCHQAVPRATFKRTNAIEITDHKLLLSTCFRCCVYCCYLSYYSLLMVAKVAIEL